MGQSWGEDFEQRKKKSPKSLEPLSARARLPCQLLLRLRLRDGF